MGDERAGVGVVNECVLLLGDSSWTIKEGREYCWLESCSSMCEVSDGSTVWVWSEEVWFEGGWLRTGWV